MKAKEYYQKYVDRMKNVSEPDLVKEVATKMFFEMSNDVNEIMKRRNAQSNKAFVSVINEVNDKWNAVVTMFESNGIMVLKRNGFIAFWTDKIPEISAYKRSKTDERGT